MVTHELNQPLTAINNYMEAASALLDRGGDLPLAGLRSAVARAGEHANRAGQIIQGLRWLVSHGECENSETGRNRGRSGSGRLNWTRRGAPGRGIPGRARLWPFLLPGLTLRLGGR